MEKIWIWIAWHLPRTLVYWAAVRIHVHASGGRWSNECPTEIKSIDILKRWAEEYEK